ncbi:hypothetical protein BCR44DRAFT_1390673 [Catenaria anguillulae PL171]|nr:hypothetical protein BCR44DRAFT_1390673 [Catenaria anguillulae PL171]
MVKKKADTLDKSNSGARVAVEWFYGCVSRKWQRITCKDKMQIMQCPVGKIYRVAVFLTNVHTCMSGGNIISESFRCAPPCVEEYIASFAEIPVGDIFSVHE